MKDVPAPQRVSDVELEQFKEYVLSEQLLKAVVVIGNETDDLKEFLRLCLGAVCMFNGWSAGSACVTFGIGDARDAVFKPKASYASGPSYQDVAEELHQISDATDPRYFTDSIDAVRLDRRSRAGKVIVAFPFMKHRRVLGHLHAIAEADPPYSESTMLALQQIGLQIGAAVDRFLLIDRLQAQMRESERMLKITVNREVEMMKMKKLLRPDDKRPGP